MECYSDLKRKEVVIYATTWDVDGKWLKLQLHLPSCSLLQGSGDSSLEKEFLGAPVGPSVSTPNSQHSSPSRSLSGKCSLQPPGPWAPSVCLALSSPSMAAISRSLPPSDFRPRVPNSTKELRV